MRALVTSSTVLIPALLLWAACVGDDPAGAALDEADGGSSSSSSSGSSSGSSSSSGGAAPDSGGSSSSSSSSSSSGALDGGVDCLGGNYVGGRCQPVTLRAGLQNPYGVTIAVVEAVPMALWVRGAPAAPGAVERCNVVDCAATVRPLAVTLGARGVDAYAAVWPVSGRTIVSDGTSVSWVSLPAGAGASTVDQAGGCASVLGGCVGPTGPTYLSMLPHAVTQLAHAGATLFVRDSLATLGGCPLGDCSSIVAAIETTDEYRRSVASNGTSLAWLQRSNAMISFCTLDGAVCADSSTFTSGSVDGYGERRPTLLDYVGDRLVGATSTTVFACTPSSCGSTMHTLATEQVNLTAVITDGTDAYWAFAGNGGGSGNTGAIYTCPVDACAESAVREVAAGLYDPRSLALHEGVLYWVEYGTASQAGSLRAIRL